MKIVKNCNPHHNCTFHHEIMKTWRVARRNHFKVLRYPLILMKRLYLRNYLFELLMNYKLAFFIPLLLFMAGCATKSNSPIDSNDNLITSSDVHSYSNVNEIRTVHLHLELDVNFDNKKVYGVARHKMSKHNVDTAIFDVKKLEIARVTLGEKEEVETDFLLGEEDDILGRPLCVKITEETEYINIYYQTTDETEAIDWLPAQLTSGKKFPFMYTQGQAILTRSWIPLQDTPLNRITYSADVKVPSELLPVMSASNPTKLNETGEYHFEMKQQIPAYLIAIAVGNLTYTPLGKNSGVYSEPELAEECAYEFVDLPKMIRAAESLYGEYRWDQFDMIILPYSFPFGGMENPRLTFANPTLLAGDRSMVAVVAHELAHSWSGNLVTNATWDDFWLNEGFTVYFETRIMEKIYGKEVGDIHKVIQRQELDVALNDLENSDHPEDTHLKLNLEERSPDEGMTDIAYTKGAYFLRTIESVVGRKKFDAFLRNYFDQHAFETITTESFVAYLNKELFEPNNVDFNTDEWIYQPGIPENCVTFHSDRLDRMNALAENINKGEDIFTGKDAKMKRDDRTTQEWQAFIRGLSDTLTPADLRKIDDQLHFSSESNAALKSEWFQLAIKVGYTEIRPEMEKHLTKIGRRWFIEGIYQELKNSDNPDDLKWAKEVFEKAQNSYHYVSKSTVEEILYPKGGKDAGR